MNVIKTITLPSGQKTLKTIIVTFIAKYSVASMLNVNNNIYNNYCGFNNLIRLQLYTYLLLIENFIKDIFVLNKSRKFYISEESLKLKIGEQFRTHKTF